MSKRFILKDNKVYDTLIGCELDNKDCVETLNIGCDEWNDNQEKDQQIAELQKQLKSQPAEIVEKIIKEVEKEKSDNDLAWLGFKKLDRILDTILKEYGEKDE